MHGRKGPATHVISLASHFSTLQAVHLTARNIILLLAEIVVITVPPLPTPIFDLLPVGLVSGDRVAPVHSALFISSLLPARLKRSGGGVELEWRCAVACAHGIRV